MKTKRTTQEDRKKVAEIIEELGVTNLIILLEDYCYDKGKNNDEYAKMACNFRGLIDNQLDS